MFGKNKKPAQIVYIYIIKIARPFSFKRQGEVSKVQTAKNTVRKPEFRKKPLKKSVVDPMRETGAECGKIFVIEDKDLVFFEIDIDKTAVFLAQRKNPIDQNRIDQNTRKLFVLDQNVILFVEKNRLRMDDVPQTNFFEYWQSNLLFYKNIGFDVCRQIKRNNPSRIILC